jgi:hypothetical protein
MLCVVLPTWEFSSCVCYRYDGMLLSSHTHELYDKMNSFLSSLSVTDIYGDPGYGSFVAVLIFSSFCFVLSRLFSRTISADISAKSRFDRIERIRRQETPLTELEAELEAEKGHSTLTNENKILRKKACLSSLKS